MGWPARKKLAGTEIAEADGGEIEMNQPNTNRVRNRDGPVTVAGAVTRIRSFP